MHHSDTIYENMTEAELEVCGYLSTLGLSWLYEQAVCLLDEKDRLHIWTTDFYLPELSLHIEIVDNDNGLNQDYRKRIYAKNKVSIVYINLRFQNWHDELVESITLIQEQRWESVKKLQKYGY